MKSTVQTEWTLEVCKNFIYMHTYFTHFETCCFQLLKFLLFHTVKQCKEDNNIKVDNNKKFNTI